MIHRCVCCKRRRAGSLFFGRGRGLAAQLTAIVDGQPWGWQRLARLRKGVHAGGGEAGGEQRPLNGNRRSLRPCPMCDCCRSREQTEPRRGPLESQPLRSGESDRAASRRVAKERAPAAIRSAPVLRGSSALLHQYSAASAADRPAAASPRATGASCRRPGWSKCRTAARCPKSREATDKHHASGLRGIQPPRWLGKVPLGSRRFRCTARSARTGLAN
jgi:hypothetical protein